MGSPKRCIGLFLANKTDKRLDINHVLRVQTFFGQAGAQVTIESQNSSIGSPVWFSFIVDAPTKRLGHTLNQRRFYKNFIIYIKKPLR